MDVPPGDQGGGFSARGLIARGSLARGAGPSGDEGQRRRQRHPPGGHHLGHGGSGGACATPERARLGRQRSGGHSLPRGAARSAGRSRCRPARSCRRGAPCPPTGATRRRWGKYAQARDHGECPGEPWTWVHDRKHNGRPTYSVPRSSRGPTGTASAARTVRTGGLGPAGRPRNQLTTGQPDHERVDHGWADRRVGPGDRRRRPDATNARPPWRRPAGRARARSGCTGDRTADLSAVRHGRTTAGPATGRPDLGAGRAVLSRRRHRHGAGRAAPPRWRGSGV
ncbi:hypothetical protein UG55_101845 [Frankia sp. EI5c]|nr:hypothetical protein UG55_101845 [Frankia sp. EI5c]